MLRNLWFAGVLVPCLPLAGQQLAAVSGEALFWFFTPIFVFVLIPLLDLAVGEYARNPSAEAEPRLLRDRHYRRAVYLFIPAQYFATAWIVAEICSGTLGVAAMIGATVSIGIVNGIGINTAHELCHGRPGLDHWLSKLALLPVAYGHFYVEHPRGHHSRVATPDDPASARLGESFYRFWPRTVFGGLASGWALERERLRRAGSPTLTWRNNILQTTVGTAALFAGLSLWLGPLALLVLPAQAVVGFSLLELVNYIEHYGLLRARLASGKREKCRPEHSWNSNALVTNLLLYNLQRHSDHHANAARPYQVLRNLEGAPQLPTGYAGMVLVSLFPPLFRRLMDHRVIEHYGGDRSRAHALPGARRP